MPIQIADTYGDTEFAQSQTGLLFNLPQPDPSVPQLPEGISLCMIVKNEERFLPECLTSVKDVVDEICIFDTGSTDRTIEIAREWGAKIELGEWRNDFSWARNQSLKMATRRWTIVLDADEELMPESVHLLRSLRTVPAGVTSVYLQIVNQIDDLSGGGTLSHNLPRIFPTNPRIRYRNVIHEGLTLDGGEIVGILTSLKILHKGYTAEVISARDKSSRNIPLLAKAVAADENDPFALFNFGVAAIQAKDAEEGIAALEKMFTIATDNRLYHALAHTMLSIGYSEYRHDDEKALETLDAGIKKFPEDPGLLFTKAQLLTTMKRFEESRATFNKLFELRRSARLAALTDDEIFEWKAHYAMAGSYVAENNIEKALECIEAALRNKPDSAFILLSKARALERLERYHDADVAFRRLAEIRPETGKVEYINFLLRRKRFSTALVMVESELAGAAPPIAAKLNAASANAVIAENLGDPAPFLETALRHAPGCGPALMLYERVLADRNDTERLERLHREELDAPCVYPEDYVRRSFILLQYGRTEDARDTAERGFLLDPADPDLRFNHAMAMLRLGDEAGALTSLRLMRPGNSDAHISGLATEAALLEKRGDQAGALEALDRWLGFDPKSTEGILRKARLLTAMGRDAEARTILETGEPGDRRVALELAGVLLKAGDIAAAGRIAATALQ
jgi:glycosyltransferase involved in cell wall biosynthesis/Flp pilus assembly protein TadD